MTSGIPRATPTEPIGGDGRSSAVTCSRATRFRPISKFAFAIHPLAFPALVSVKLSGFVLSFVCCVAPFPAYAAEEVVVPIERVHLCCDDCVEGIRRAVTSAGATDIAADQDGSRLVIFAPDT